MRYFLKGFFGVVAVGVVAAGLLTIRYRALPAATAGDEKLSLGKRMTGALLGATDLLKPEAAAKSPQELYQDALQRSSKINGLYMTADVANDQGAGAARLRHHVITLAKTTEINGVVIDVKEVCGPDYAPARLKALLSTLHENHIWAIGRIVTFKDASQIYSHPEWYLKRASPKKVSDQCANRKYLRAAGGAGSGVIFWRDNKGGYWLDPASQGAREYIVSFAKQMADLGFDELQFDYVRFPSDGDVDAAVYPAWNHKTEKYEVMKSFFSFLGQQLRAYKPDIIISADLFGYVALNSGDVGIGQRLQDIGESFDYISFMVYPSHYYSGLYLRADPAHNLPPVSLDKKGVRTHPDITVGRSLRQARDFLDGIPANKIEQSRSVGPSGGTAVVLAAASTTTDTAVSTDKTVLAGTQASHVRLRPWLEDFFHEQDKAADRPYGVEKVRLQIDAAQRVEQHGWLLWNASNVYTEGALRKKDSTSAENSR